MQLLFIHFKHQTNIFIEWFCFSFKNQIDRCLLNLFKGHKEKINPYSIIICSIIGKQKMVKQSCNAKISNQLRGCPVKVITDGIECLEQLHRWKNAFFTIQMPLLNMLERLTISCKEFKITSSFEQSQLIFLYIYINMLVASTG